MAGTQCRPRTFEEYWLEIALWFLITLLVLGIMMTIYFICAHNTLLNETSVAIYYF